MGFFATFEVMYRAQEIFLVFSQMSSFSTTRFLQNELLNSRERFFFTKIRPYQVLTVFFVIFQLVVTIFEKNQNLTSISEKQK